MVNFKGAHFIKDIILTCVRWYVAYPLSYRQVEELMQERGVSVDHATINRWVLKYSPQLEEVFHRRKRSVWLSWRMDETYIKVAQIIGLCSSVKPWYKMSISISISEPLSRQQEMLIDAEALTFAPTFQC